MAYYAFLFTPAATQTQPPIVKTQKPNKMTIEQEGDIDGAFMSMCYDRVPAFLHSALKSVFNTIEELEKKIKILESKIN